MILTKSNQEHIQSWLDTVHSDGAAVLIDKDLHWTSFDVIAKMRRIVNIRKIGHAGTLDPLASGLLIVCLGKFTKKINEFQDAPKTYLATIKLGATTKSDDSEFEEENIQDTSNITINDIQNVISGFIGSIEQRPPDFSAKKINGRKLYEMARKNQFIDIPTSSVTINSIKIIRCDLPSFDVMVSCEKGTYIRALARDIGAKLGVGGYLSALRRTKIGEYNADESVRIQELENLIVNI